MKCIGGGKQTGPDSTKLTVSKSGSVSALCNNQLKSSLRSLSYQNFQDPHSHPFGRRPAQGSIMYLDKN